MYRWTKQYETGSTSMVHAAGHALNPARFGDESVADECVQTGLYDALGHYFQDLPGLQDKAWAEYQAYKVRCAVAVIGWLCGDRHMKAPFRARARARAGVRVRVRVRV